MQNQVYRLFRPLRQKLTIKIVNFCHLPATAARCFQGRSVVTATLSNISQEYDRFARICAYYFTVKDIAYYGEWGETLYDFFCPEDDSADYSEQYNYFAPLAAALSSGQRAGLEFLTLSTLLRIAADSDSAMEADFPSTTSLFKDKDGNEMENISIYSGINRAIFRKGVALTSNALMQKNLGKNPYDELWDEGGIIDIVSYSGLVLGGITLISGAIMFAKTQKEINALMEIINGDAYQVFDEEEGFWITMNGEFDRCEARQNLQEVMPVNTVGRWLMGIGGALMIAAAALKGVQIYQYYHRDFTKIPIMIVDESDIVSYTTDKNGKPVRIINFDQFAYYEVVKCNRQEIGLHKNVQNGVSDYLKWGCGSVADINADVGKQWLAMYVNRSDANGKPILADTFVLQKGSDKTPDGCNGCLHMFTFEDPMKLDDTTYCYRDDNNGMYLFWKGDETAFAKSTGEATSTASAFNAGYLALAGIGGLALGILGTTFVMFPILKKKKDETAE